MDSGTIQIKKRLIVRANPEVSQRKLVVRHVKPCDDVHPVGFRVQSRISSTPTQQQKIVQVSVPRQDLQAAQSGKPPQQNHHGPKYNINVPLIQLNITNKGIEIEVMNEKFKFRTSKYTPHTGKPISEVKLFRGEETLERLRS